MRVKRDLESGILRNDADGKLSRALRRTKEFALAGAMGLAVIFGSSSQSLAQTSPAPASAPATSAPAPTGTTATEVKPDEPKAPTEAEKTKTLVKKWQKSEGDKEYPTQSTSSVELAQVTLETSKLLELARAPAPLPTDPNKENKEIYDAVMSEFGGNPQNASSFLLQAQISSIKRLNQLVQEGGSVGSDSVALEELLVKINTSIDSGDETYELSGRAVNDLILVLRGSETKPAIRPQDRFTEGEHLSLVEMMPYDFGSQFLLSSRGSKSYQVLDGQSTPAADSTFKGPDVNSATAQGYAQEAINALANASATFTDLSSDINAQNRAGQRLYDALNQIPKGKEIWNTEVHPHFNNAMTALAGCGKTGGRCDLRYALGELGQEMSLNAIYSQTNNIHRITFNQRAVAKYRASLMLRFPETVNIEEFADYRNGSDRGPYAWDVLHYDFGGNYARLVMNGRDETLKVDQTTGLAMPTGESKAVLGSANALDAGASVTWGGSIFGDPVEPTFGLRIGYLWGGIDKTIDVNGNPTPLQAQLKSGYGVISFDVDRVGYEGRKWRVRVSKWGLGGFNLWSPNASTKDVFDFYPYAYATATWNVLGDKSWGRWEMNLTPQYLLFWGHRPDLLEENLFFQHRLGVDFSPASFTFQAGEQAGWYVGGSNAAWVVGLGAHYTLSTENWDIKHDAIHSVEPYGTVKLRTSAGFSIDARVGHSYEFGGDESLRAPSIWTGSLNVILTPADWFKSTTAPLEI